MSSIVINSFIINNGLASNNNGCVNDKLQPMSLAIFSNSSIMLLVVAYIRKFIVRFSTWHIPAGNIMIASAATFNRALRCAPGCSLERTWYMNVH